MLPSINATSVSGIIMILLLLIQVCSVTIIAERCYLLYFKTKVNLKSDADVFLSHLKTANPNYILDYANAQVWSPLLHRIIASMCKNSTAGGPENLKELDKILDKRQRELESRIDYLAMLGNMATVIALIGTIFAMVHAFGILASNPAGKAELLGLAVSEAMKITAYGLITAIPSLVMYSVLQNRVNQLSQDSMDAVMRVMGFMDLKGQHPATKSNR